MGQILEQIRGKPGGLEAGGPNRERMKRIERRKAKTLVLPSSREAGLPTWGSYSEAGIEGWGQAKGTPWSLQEPKRSVVFFFF